MSSPSRLSLAPVLAVAVAALVVSACETLPMGGGSGGAMPASAVFLPQDFAWSERSGRASIEGRVAYRAEGKAYSCTGNVGLTPDTPYTRARIRTLYGATDRAAIPEAVVRARTVPDPNANYSRYVRQQTCAGGNFTFSDLPDGSWYVIVPVSAGGERVILMRRVDTRGGRVSVTL